MADFKRARIYSICSNYLKEDYNYKLQFNFIDNTDDILYKSFYKIEYLYLVKKLKTKNFKIYEVEYLKDDSKVVYVRLLGSDLLRKVRIPKLDIFYKEVDVYSYKKVYIWKSKKGIRKVYTREKLYNRHEHRYYQVSDINKYGHVLTRITSEKVYSHSYSCIDSVGLKF